MPPKVEAEIQFLKRIFSNDFIFYTYRTMRACPIFTSIQNNLNNLHRGQLHKAKHQISRLLTLQVKTRWFLKFSLRKSSDPSILTQWTKLVYSGRESPHIPDLKSGFRDFQIFSLISQSKSCDRAIFNPREITLTTFVEISLTMLQTKYLRSCAYGFWQDFQGVYILHI